MCDLCDLLSLLAVTLLQGIELDTLTLKLHTLAVEQLHYRPPPLHFFLPIRKRIGLQQGLQLSVSTQDSLQSDADIVDQSCRGAIPLDVQRCELGVPQPRVQEVFAVELQFPGVKFQTKLPAYVCKLRLGFYHQPIVINQGKVMTGHLSQSADEVACCQQQRLTIRELIPGAEGLGHAQRISIGDDVPHLYIECCKYFLPERHQLGSAWIFYTEDRILCETGAQ